MTEAARRDAAFKSALERLPSAVVIVDSRRQLQPYNSRGSELFEREALRGDLLESRPAHPLSALISSILSSSEEPTECTLTFPSGQRYRVEPSRRSPKGEGRWLMLLVSATTDAPASLDALRLTPREREVATRLTAGQSSDAICAALTISRETLKTHLRRIYEKSGTSNRAEFIAKMLRGS